MKKPDVIETGIVVEAFDLDKTHRVLVVRNWDKKNYIFFYIGRVPEVDMGDLIIINFSTEKYYVQHGNARLAYKVTPLEFPDDLLCELLIQRMN